MVMAYYVQRKKRAQEKLQVEEWRRAEQLAAETAKEAARQQALETSRPNTGSDFAGSKRSLYTSTIHTTNTTLAFVYCINVCICTRKTQHNTHIHTHIFTNVHIHMYVHTPCMHHTYTHIHTQQPPFLHHTTYNQNHQPHYTTIAEALAERQKKALEAAKSRHAKVDSALQKKLERERRMKEAGEVLKLSNKKEVSRSLSRMQSATRASDSARITVESLDDAGRRRRSVSAHSAPVAMSGRDLQFSGRGTTKMHTYIHMYYSCSTIKYSWCVVVYV